MNDQDASGAALPVCITPGCRRAMSGIVSNGETFPWCCMSCGDERSPGVGHDPDCRKKPAEKPRSTEDDTK